ncbi:MAG: sulfite exporter TauE/SafE family protein [Patescibacteria group bacterium]|jgi:sulfite exporter TauE/SafE/copper chaperone CopZ
MSSKKKNKFSSSKSGMVDDFLGNRDASSQAGKVTVPIRGMHCRSCEILITEKLEEIAAVKNVHVSYKKSQAEIYTRGSLDMSEVRAAVREAGYEVGVDDSKDWISRDPAKYRDLAYAFVVLLLLYFVARQLGLSNINVGGGDKPSSLAVVLVVGLTAGISTCMALVGGLVLGISARFSEKHPEATPAQKFRPHIFFVLGRTISYFVLGGVIGLAGKAFQLSSPTLGFLTIAVGLVMLALGAQLTEIFPRLSSSGLTLPSSISRFFGLSGRHQKEYSHTNSLITGALTFFLPCGFTQAMQLYAMSTGSFWSGAAIMGVFALGTAPGLLGIGGLTSVIQGAFAKRFFKFAGLLVVALAFFNLANGWNLTGWKLPSLGSSAGSGGSSSDSTAKNENGVQVVNMTQDADGYSPNSFTVNKGVPVKWVINSVDSQTCAASISFSKFAIRKTLKPGENIIEFTPREAGTFKFSCSMGMYRGSFKVVDDKSASLPADTDSSRQKSDLPSITQSQTPVQTDSGQDQSKSETGAAKPNSTQQNKTEPASSTQPKPLAESDSAPSTDKIQVVKTSFSESTLSQYSDIYPNEFTVKANQPVRFEVAAEVDGVGCMSTIMIPGLVDEPELLEQGKTITFNFTPTKKGNYDITCAMGVPRGTLTVV